MTWLDQLNTLTSFRGRLVELTNEFDLRTHNITTMSGWKHYAPVGMHGCLSMYAQGGASGVETGNQIPKKEIPGLSTACSTVASMTAPFSASIGPLRTIGNGNMKLREAALSNPVVGAAHKMLCHDNPSEDPAKLKDQFLCEYGR